MPEDEYEMLTRRFTHRDFLHGLRLSARADRDDWPGRLTT